MLRVVSLLNEFGRWLVSHLGQMSIELTILAAVVLAALYLLRVRSPKLRHLFWCLVLAKPVATFLIASPVSLYGFMMPASETPAAIEAPSIVETAGPTAAPRWSHAPVPRAPRPAMTPRTAPRPWQEVDRYGAASLVWLLVAGAFGMRLLMGCAYVGFLRQTAETQDKGPLADLALEAAQALGMRRPVAIGLTNVAHGPVLAGVIRPVILLPETLADALSSEQLRLVVTHELAHARRWDNLVLLMQRLAEMFLFFHPVVWMCGWIMRREAEAACDDAVVEAYGGGEDDRTAAAYADSLTRVAEMKCGITRRLLVNTFAAAESNFTRRVRRILSDRRGRMTIWVSAATVVALVLIAAVGLPTAAVRDDKEDAPQLVGEGVLLDDLPHGEGDCNGYVRGLTTILNYCGVEADYDTLMGDSGLAFILQAEPDGAQIEGAVDVGWWPLAPWGFLSRIEFAGKTVGRDLSCAAAASEEFKDSAQYYRDHWQPLVEASIAARKPLLGIIPTGFVIAGYDEGDPPLLGMWSCEEPSKVLRLEEYPWGLVSVSEPVAPLDRREADIQALQHAVALGRGGVDLSTSLGCPDTPQSERRLTGKRAWFAWCYTLREEKPRGQARWHANMCRHLRVNRESAVRYLRAVAERHPEPVAENIRIASGLYEKVLAKLAEVDTREEILASAAGRAALRALVAHMGNLEGHAVDALATALVDTGADVPTLKGAWPAETAPRQVLLRDLPRLERHEEPYDFDMASLAAVLNHAGAPADYATLMGDSGRAFIFQVAPVGSRDGPAMLKPTPLAPWGFLPRLDFVGRTVGRELDATVLEDYDGDGKQLKQFHLERIRPIVDAELAANRPLVAIDNTSYVLVGYQTASADQFSGFLGMSPLSRHGSINWIREYVLGVATVGEATAVMDRREADIEALRHAVALGRDTAFTAPGEDALPCLTGQRALRHWCVMLRDDTQIARPSSHTWFCERLAMNRQSAVPYLRAMARRHAGTVAKHLGLAAEHYERVLDELAPVERIYETGTMPPGERDRLAERIERVAALEQKAVAELEQAFAAAGGPAPAALSPQTAQPAAARNRPQCFITLLSGEGGPEGQGRVTVQGREVATWEELSHALERLHARKSNITVVVRGDRYTRIDQVRRVFELVKAAGIEDFGVAGFCTSLSDYSEGSRQRLLQWASIFGPSIEECFAGAQRNLAIFDLLAIERALEPISQDAKRIRRAMTALEPADMAYLAKVQAIVDAVASLDDGALPRDRVRDGELILPNPGWDERIDYVRQHAQALNQWANGVPLAQARDTGSTTAAIVEEVYGLLGERDDEKRGLALMAVDIMHSGEADPDDLAALRASPLLAAFADYFEVLDAQLWSYERNLRMLLADIGRLNAVRQWHTPDGPVAWADGNPEDEAGLAREFEALQAYLDGEVEAVDLSLGARDAYKEKQWLLRCLVVYLKDHRSNYYEWYKVEANPMTEKPSNQGQPVATLAQPAKELDGYRWKPMWVSHIGCLKAAAEYLGVDVSASWLFGATGYAFVLNIHEAMCPSGWHVVDVPVKARVAAVGLEIEYLAEPRHSFDRKVELQKQAWDGVRRAIDAGNPCYGYDLEIGDYYVVYGYDDTGYYYSGPMCDDGKGPLGWEDYGVKGQVGVIYMMAVTAGTRAEDDQIVRDALALAAKQGEQVEGGNELYAGGLAGYDQWVTSLETGKAESLGAAYNAACYAECRKNAVEFLKEAKERLDDEELAPLFDEAIARYEQVAQSLREVAEAFPFFERKPEHIEDAARLKSAVQALKAAQAAEAEGLQALAKVAEALGA